VVDTYESDYSTPKETYSIGETVYAKGTGLNAGNQYDFKYYSNWGGTPVLEYTQSNVAEGPSGQWRSFYALQGEDPTGAWGVRVYDAGTSNLRCSCSFTVQAAIPEFPCGAMAVLTAGFAIFLAKRKTLRRRGKEP